MAVKKTTRRPILEFQADNVDSFVPDPIDNGLAARRPLDNQDGETMPSVIDARLAFLTGVFRLLQGMSPEAMDQMFGNLLNDYKMDNSALLATRPATTGNAATLRPGGGYGDQMMATEEFNKLFADSGLTEATQQRLQNIFDIAVSEKVILEKEKLRVQSEQKEKDLSDAMQAALQTSMHEMANQLDGYLSLITEKWLEQNKIAVEDGIKVQLAESMIVGAKSLVESHHIKISDKQIDVAEKLRAKLVESNAKYNALVNDLVEARKLSVNVERDRLIENASTELTKTQKDRMIALMEDIPFVDAAQFKAKLKIIKEKFLTETKRPSGFSGGKTFLTEDVGSVKPSNITDSAVAQYSAALDRIVQSSK